MWRTQAASWTREGPVIELGNSPKLEKKLENCWTSRSSLSCGVAVWALKSWNISRASGGSTLATPPLVVLHRGGGAYLVPRTFLDEKTVVELNWEHSFPLRLPLNLSAFGFVNGISDFRCWSRPRISKFIFNHYERIPARYSFLVLTEQSVN